MNEQRFIEIMNGLQKHGLYDDYITETVTFDGNKDDTSSSIKGVTCSPDLQHFFSVTYYPTITGNETEVLYSTGNDSSKYPLQYMLPEEDVLIYQMILSYAAKVYNT